MAQSNTRKTDIELLQSPNFCCCFKVSRVEYEAAVCGLCEKLDVACEVIVEALNTVILEFGQNTERAISYVEQLYLGDAFKILEDTEKLRQYEWDLLYIEQNKDGWHTNHEFARCKRGISSKQHYAPNIYWYRVRSFCVRKGYH